MGKTVDNIAEEQQGEKSHNQHGKKFHSQNVAEVLHTLEIKQDTVADKKCTGPEKQADYTKYKEFYPDGSFITEPQAIPGRKKTGF